DQRPAHPDRPVLATPHDLLELTTLLIGQPPRPYPFRHRHHPTTKAVVDLYHDGSPHAGRHTENVCGQRASDTLATGPTSVCPAQSADPSTRSTRSCGTQALDGRSGTAQIGGGPDGKVARGRTRS